MARVMRKVFGTANADALLKRKGRRAVKNLAVARESAESRFPKLRATAKGSLKGQLHE